VLADQASALRPDVPAIQHTRALALLGVGRTDDALHVLDGNARRWRSCRRASRPRVATISPQRGTRKVKAAYADDYRRRAAVLAT